MRALTGWLKFGGVEVSNPRRTLGYLRRNLHNDARLYAYPAGDCDCSALPSGPFLSPAADGAAWYIATRSDSVEFLGLLISSIDVSDPLARAVNPRGGDGNTVGRVRQRGRTISVTGTMFASSQRGMEWGRKWLAEVLRGSDTTDACVLDDLELLPACPPFGEQNYFRTMKRVGVLDGLSALPLEDIPGGLMQEVRFQLASEIPWLYAPGTAEVTNQAIALASRTCGFADNTEWFGNATTKVTIAAGAGVPVTGLRVTYLKSTAGCDPLDQSEAYWRAADFISGQQLNDGSGNGHHAQLGSAGTADANDPTFLGLESDGLQYAYFPGIAGNDASIPDSTAFNEVSEATLDKFEIRGRVAADDWTPSATQALCSKWTAAGNQRQFRLLLLTTGVLRFEFSTTGADTVTVDSTVATGLADGSRKYLRVRRERSPNEVKFYTSDDGNTWTQLGATVTPGSATIAFNSTASFTIGSSDGAMHFAGKIWEVRLGVPIVADTFLTEVHLSFSHANLAAPFASFIAFTGEVVTINRAATGKKTSIVDRDLFLFGTDDYLEIPDHAGLDFAATDPFTVVIAYRVYGTTTAQVLVAKKTNLTTAAGWAIARGAVANVAQFYIADGAADDNDDIASAATEGVALHVAGRRSVALDQVEAFKDGVASATPTTDSTTATLANAEVMRIGRLSGAGTSYGDFEFFGAAVFRTALSAADIDRVGDALIGDPDTTTPDLILQVASLASDYTLVIDGTERSVEVTNASGDIVGGLEYLRPETGLFKFPDADPFGGLCICVEANGFIDENGTTISPAVNAGTTWSLDTYEREL